MDLVGKYYKSGLLDEVNEYRYGTLYSNLIEELIYLENHNEDLFCEKIETDIKIKEYSKLLFWINRYHEKYPRSEKPYIFMMKYYYLTNNISGIKETLKNIENSHVNITREGYEIMRYWSNLA